MIFSKTKTYFFTCISYFICFATFGQDLNHNKIKKDFLTLFNDKGNGKLTEYMYYADEGNNYYSKFIQSHKAYYLYDEEIEIIRQNKHILSKYLKNNPNIIDIGPGTNTALEKKTLPILKALKNFQSYLAFDIHAEYACNAAKMVHQNFPDVLCQGMIASFTQQNHMDFLKKRKLKNKCIFFLGSTIGGCNEKLRNRILQNLSDILLPGDYMLLTLDCNQNEKSLLKAYQNHYNNLLCLNIIKFFKDYY